MALRVEVGEITLPSSGPTGSANATLTKFSDAHPLKAIIFLGSHNDATGIVNTNAFTSIGFATSANTTDTDQVTTSASVSDGTVNSATRRCHVGGYVYNIINPASTLVARGRVTAFANTGFTVSFDSLSIFDRKITYIAIGGSDIEDVAIVNWHEPQDDEVSPKFISVGFQPTCILSTSIGGFNLNAGVTNFRHSFGVCIGGLTSNQRAICWSSENNLADSAGTTQMQNSGVLSTGEAVAYSDSLLTPTTNGFDVQPAHDINTNTGSHFVSSLCIRGGTIGVLNTTAPASVSTWTFNTTEGASRTTLPEAVIVATHGGALGRVDDMRASLGVFDGTTQRVHGILEQNGAATMQAYSVFHNDRIVQTYTDGSTSEFTGTMSFEGSNINIDWSDVSGTEASLLMLVFLNTIDETTFWCPF